MSKDQNFSAIVLAAGEGKRMQSHVPKVLTYINGKPIIQKILETLQKTQAKEIVLVVNQKVENQIKDIADKKIKVRVQKEAKGTLDATKEGLKGISSEIDNVAILYGDDTAFYEPEIIENVFKNHLNSSGTVTFVTLKKDDPSGMGRIIRKNGQVTAIVEEKDATEAQKQIKEINDGLYFFDKNWIEKNISKISPSKITGEYYITDLIELAINQKKTVQGILLENNNKWHGINTQEELKRARKKFGKRLHFMGISGSGAAAVAAISHEKGFIVDGCDIEPNSAYSKNLTGIAVKNGHDASHIAKADILIFSPAVLKNDPDNTEFKAAKESGVPIIAWQQFQADYLQEGKFVIAVAGAYGKSTTTAMISKILIDQSLDPTCEIGAKVKEWGANFRLGDSKYYICEADEYNNNFLFSSPDIAVILNMAWDHPDFFPSRSDLEKSYISFTGKIKKNGILIIKDDININKILPKIRKDIRVIKISDFGKLNLAIIGKFRNQNANAALTLAKILNLDINKAKKSIEKFQGIARRLEFKGKTNGFKFYDDYAVQPFTIKATANALKDKFPKEKVFLVFEPHTFSRIKIFFTDFVKDLSETNVDKILITDVFAAREKGDGIVLSQKLASAIGKKAVYIGDLKRAGAYIRHNLDKGIVLSMGAGKAYMLWDIMSFQQ